MPPYRYYHVKRQSRFSFDANDITPIALTISRILTGLVFSFSGFVKSIDPLGSTYKIEDYLTAFGGLWVSLKFIAFPAAIALSTLELLIGLNLLFGIHIRRSGFLAFIFMLVMTPLTLYIAIFNPVTDCGCFGDALVIPNWATFFKNIVFLLLTIIIISTSRKLKPLLLPYIEWIMILVFAGTGIGLSLYSYNHLPIIDFRPYKVGVNIPEDMKIPEGAESPKDSTTFIYEKNGVQKEFSLNNYPKDDSTWVFVDQKTTIISKGYEPPIHNFSIVDNDYNDITNEVIEYPGYVYLVVMYDLTSSSVEGATKAEKIYQRYKKTTTKFYALTASGDDEIAAFREKTKVTYPFCKTDPITLKTIIRSNPGLVLIKNGTIEGKWHWNDF